jgi:hypothetical protein
MIYRTIIEENVIRDICDNNYPNTGITRLDNLFSWLEMRAFICPEDKKVFLCADRPKIKKLLTKYNKLFIRNNYSIKPDFIITNRVTSAANSDFLEIDNKFIDMNLLDKINRNIFKIPISKKDHSVTVDDVFSTAIRISKSLEVFDFMLLNNIDGVEDYQKRNKEGLLQLFESIRKFGISMNTITLYVTKHNVFAEKDEKIKIIKKKINVLAEVLEEEKNKFPGKAPMIVLCVKEKILHPRIWRFDERFSFIVDFGLSTFTTQYNHDIPSYVEIQNDPKFNLELVNEVIDKREFDRIEI